MGRLHIDTSHEYKDAKMELEVVRLKIAKGGIIVGHDYRTGRFVPESCSFLKYAVIEAVHEFMI
ncbi:MAG: class I SAM-dependent methyltransferase [Desulfomicrobium sp.]|nr:class I SAM-dependent methyltransferase [Desulfomicrobium sp.]NLV97829.1 class I SAM-dependent methyltransferase [Desulfovibrionales bacterium]